MKRRIGWKAFTMLAAVACLWGCASEVDVRRRAAGRSSEVKMLKGPFQPDLLKQRGLEPAWAFPFGKEEGVLARVFLCGQNPSHPDTIYAQTEGTHLYAIDGRSGSPLWATRDVRELLSVPPSQTDKSLYLVTQNVLFVYDVERKAARYDERNVPVSFFNPAGELRYRLPMKYIPSTPAASNNQYVAFGTAAGTLYSIPTWRIDEAIQRGAIPPLLSSLIQWEHQSEGIVLPPIWSPPSKNLSDPLETLIVCFAEGKILRCNLHNFREGASGVWEFTRCGPMNIGPYMHQDYLFAASNDRNLYILRHDDGYYLGGIDLGGLPTSAPMVTGDTPADYRIYVNVEGVGFVQIRVDDPSYNRNVIPLKEETKEGEAVEVARIPLPLWLLSTGWTIPRSLEFVAQGGRALYLFDPEKRELLAVDPQTGKEKWRERLPGVWKVFSNPNLPVEGENGPAMSGRILLATPTALHCFVER